MSRPLRVLEITSTVAGAVCGRLFAALGHDVVLVESVDESGLRAHPPFSANGESLLHAALNADKRGLAGITREGLTATTRALLDAADVLVVDLSPGSGAAFGLDTAQLRSTHPDLIVVSVTGFGPDGELSELPSDSLLAESYGGLATMIGQAGQRPLSLGGDQAAYCAGITGFLGALLAVMRREQGQAGDVIDVALCDVSAYMDWKSDVSYFMTGQSPARAPADDGDWRLVRSADGWVGLIFLPRHWPAVVELIDDDALRAPDLADDRVRSQQPQRWWPAVERWAAGLPAQEIYERAQHLGLPFGWVVRVSDIAASTQLQQRGFIAAPDSEQRARAAAAQVPAVGSPIDGHALPWRSGSAPADPAEAALAWQSPAVDPAPAPPPCDAPRPADALSPSDALPLAGVVVLDFGTITAGAAVTRILADHGATILKIESLARPDTFRTWKLSAADVAEQAASGQTVTSPYFPSNNVGKRDIAIDLKTAEGQELVRELARYADIVVENFRVGVTQRLGIDEASLRAVNPDLIYLSLSSQGQVGPEAANRSFGSTLDLLSGLASLTGYAEDHPMWSSYEVNYPDQLVSLIGAAALVHCLRERRTGVHLDISQREVVTWTLAADVGDYLANGHDSRITGNRRAGSTPRDTYPAREPDAWIAIACSSDAHRSALARWLNRADLAEFDGHWWAEHADEIDQAITERTTTIGRDELARQLRAAGVPAVAVLTAADRAGDAHFAQRQVAFTGDGPPVKGFPMTFADYRPARNTSAPAIGQDTRAVLLGLGGLTPAQLSRLQDSGVVHCHPESVTTQPAATAG